MATVVQPIIEPDTSAIKEHLDTLFAPCAEEYPQGLIELRYGAAFTSAYFSAHPEGIAEAAAFAANRNREGANVYVGVNPRKPATKGAANDSDVAIAFYQFADLDDAEAVEMAGQRLKALPPTMTVTTGLEPHRRPHFYWQLEEPVGNMAAWTERQRGIAQSLGGDAVINPSRIMRLAGTVNYPPQHKLAKGYRMELTSLRTRFSDEREPVTPDQITAAFPGRSSAGDHVSPGAGQSTLSAMRRTQVGDLIDACRRGDQWHNNMIRLVAHLAGKDRTSAEIFAIADHITLPGYSVQQTLREMQTALEGARTKYGFAEPVDDVETEEAGREEADSIFPLLDFDEIDRLPPPTWLVHEMIAEQGLSVIYGDPGAGKSFIALDMALRVAIGMGWHGTQSMQTGVLYIAGEGSAGLAKRIKGWKREHGLEGADAPFLLLPIAVQLLDEKHRAKLVRTIDAAIARAGFKIGLIVIDTVSRALAGADENGQESMSAFVAACDEIKLHTGGAVIGVHHSGKDKEKGMRGSTVLLGGCDASIRISKSDEIVTLKTEKQKDAEEAEPIYMRMKKVTWAQGLEEEQSTLVPFRSEAPAIEREDLSNEQIAKAFGIIADKWIEASPLSTAPNTRAQGRYAPSVLSSALGCPERLISTYLTSWLETGCLAIEIADQHTKSKGLRVLNPIIRGA
ncbi:AAA family ATPase [Caenibius sp. WL]|uniref:AAA family ATPase n=1 Tax=Caenibius sp. WL TaxID=2872646 RepID=UPI001C99B526|nr:AAA family ATPase [Caenibius sp. WL]QZP07788.1 helicase RepA family protein [Caenibius sp. WL]QZP09979.1 helicase RepA family protein [Caenibius sp. WL]